MIEGKRVSSEGAVQPKTCTDMTTEEIFSGRWVCFEDYQRLVAKERSLLRKLLDVWQGMNLKKDCQDIYEELERSDVANYLKIMMSNIWNGINKLDTVFGEVFEVKKAEA